MHLTCMQVPSLAAYYNGFMNAVDLFDQQCVSHFRIRREKRVSMSLLTFAVYISLQNTFFVAPKIEPSSILFAKTKQRVAV